MATVLTTAQLAAIFGAIVSPRFVALRGYTSATSGEVAHHRLNVGVSSTSAKKADALDYEAALANGTFAGQPELLAACQLLHTRAVANLDDKTRSFHSQAALDGRTEKIGNGRAVFLNEATGEIYVEGYSLGKEVVTAGTYKEVKSKPETIAQNKVKKQLGIRMATWRTWKISAITAARLHGDEIVVEVAEAVAA